jgi:hypothetical protein
MLTYVTALHQAFPRPTITLACCRRICTKRMGAHRVEQALWCCGRLCTFSTLRGSRGSPPEPCAELDTMTSQPLVPYPLMNIHGGPPKGQLHNSDQFLHVSTNSMQLNRPFRHIVRPATPPASPTPLFRGQPPTTTRPLQNKSHSQCRFRIRCLCINPCCSGPAFI